MRPAALWASLPIFLRNPHYSANQGNMPDTSIEYWDGAAWQAMPEDQDADGIPELISTTAIRLGRDFGSGPKYGYISFESAQSMRLSEAVWQRTYQIWAGGEKMRNLHIDLHGSPGTAQTLPATTSVTYTIQTTDPTSDDGGSGTSSQTIQLQQGWNLVAARVAPSNTELETVLSDVMDHILLVKDENGKIYSPSDDVNEIGAWDVKESYLIYADADVAFAIEGQSVDASSTPLALSAEWNLVPFYGTSALRLKTQLLPLQTTSCSSRTIRATSIIPRQA